MAGSPVNYPTIPYRVLDSFTSTTPPQPQVAPQRRYSPRHPGKCANQNGGDRASIRKFRPCQRSQTSNSRAQLRRNNHQPSPELEKESTWTVCDGGPECAHSTGPARFPLCRCGAGKDLAPGSQKCSLLCHAKGAKRTSLVH